MYPRTTPTKIAEIKMAGKKRASDSSLSVIKPIAKAAVYAPHA